MRLPTLAAAFALTCLPLTVLGAPADTLRVTGAVAKPGVWTAARLRAELSGDIHTITYTLKGVKHTAHAVPLLSVLGAAQPRLNPHIKHHELQFVVAAQGFDGYTADFTLAELQPDYGHRAAWLALDQDGRPFPTGEGEFSLIVPEDTKPARWVHGTVALTVIDEARAPAASGA